MAKKPGAGGVILVAVILGLVTAYLIWAYLSSVERQNSRNWEPVVVARDDIGPRIKVTREMITFFPPGETKAAKCLEVVRHAGQCVGMDKRLVPGGLLSEYDLARCRPEGSTLRDDARVAGRVLERRSEVRPRVGPRL